MNEIELYKIAVIITCHNRKDCTSKSLNSLFQQQGISTKFLIDVYLVDDASTDGTKELITKQFPSVHIIDGNGELFWNRGMYLSWETAASRDQYDYFLWLNDDTFLFENALSTSLTDCPKDSIIVGTTCSKNANKITYGGSKNSKSRVIPNNQFQECDYFNGNFVLIPQAVFKKVGNLDTIFHHAVGDFDYGMRAKRMGFQIFVAPEVIGNCESHDKLPNWRNPSISINKRIKSLYSPSSGCYPTQFFVFDNRHNGFIIAVFHFFTLHLRAFFPSLWNFKKN